MSLFKSHLNWNEKLDLKPENVGRKLGFQNILVVSHLRSSPQILPEPRCLEIGLLGDGRRVLTPGWRGRPVQDERPHALWPPSPGLIPVVASVGAPVGCGTRDSSEQVPSAGTCHLCSSGQAWGLGFGEQDLPHKRPSHVPREHLSTRAPSPQRKAASGAGSGPPPRGSLPAGPYLQLFFHHRGLRLILVTHACGEFQHTGRKPLRPLPCAHPRS